MPIHPFETYNVEDSRPDRIPVSPDLTVARHIGVNVDDEPELGYDLQLEAEWNEEAVRYDMTRIELIQRDGGPAITGESLRAVPVQQLLRRVLSVTVLIGRLDEPRTGHHRVELTDELAQSLAAQGPKPDTLLWAARIYRAAQIRLDPPTQEVAKVFGIPHRTASHWIKLARERGVME